TDFDNASPILFKQRIVQLLNTIVFSNSLLTQDRTHLVISILEKIHVIQSPNHSIITDEELEGPLQTQSYSETGRLEGYLQEINDLSGLEGNEEGEQIEIEDIYHPENDLIIFLPEVLELLSASLIQTSTPEEMMTVEDVLNATFAYKCIAEELKK
ncbi:5600_t:CDS:2, partial [Ambispora leptoticha]